MATTNPGTSTQSLDKSLSSLKPEQDTESVISSEQESGFTQMEPVRPQAEATQTVRAKMTLQEEPLIIFDFEKLSPSDLLVAKIDLAWRLLFELESNPDDTTKPPPPVEISPLTDNIYIAWCNSTTRQSYKQRLYLLLEEHRIEEKELEEPFQCRESVLEPIRQVRTKIEGIKQFMFDYQAQKSTGERNLPDLPRRYCEMDLDVFMICCLKSRSYVDCRRSKVYVKNPHANTKSFEEEIGLLLKALIEKEERMKRLVSNVLRDFNEQ
ncbi:hypothetical protein BGZ49_008381 [Haplosporangium sp. Z 27]|nr:hypothetical protein BGZ49_008381 [Haplosporangium sp. Z 27]